MSDTFLSIVSRNVTFWSINIKSKTLIVVSQHYRKRNRSLVSLVKSLSVTSKLCTYWWCLISLCVDDSVWACQSLKLSNPKHGCSSDGVPWYFKLEKVKLFHVIIVPEMYHYMYRNIEQWFPIWKPGHHKGSQDKSEGSSHDEGDREEEKYSKLLQKMSQIIAVFLWNTWYFHFSMPLKVLQIRKM